jgi:hypothetical protein
VCLYQRTTQLTAHHRSTADFFRYCRGSLRIDSGARLRGALGAHRTIRRSVRWSAAARPALEPRGEEAVTNRSSASMVSRSRMRG